MSKRFAVSLIILVAALGVTLRAWGINRHLLWQDEAESGIYALQILEAGYPNAEFHGERLYENRSFIESASPAIMLVPCPDSEAPASCCTGVCLVLV